MSLIHIVDCNNWVRNQYEVDPTGLALRNLFNEGFHSPDLYIYVFDGFNSRAKRKALYSAYKEGRKKGSDNFYETLKLFKELVGYTKQFKIEIPEWEADDVIGHLVKYRTPGTRIKIYSTDRDFDALVCDEVTTNHTAMACASPLDVRLYKVLVKDKSDNIKGIAGFGDVAWLKLSPEDKESWKAFLSNKQQHFPITALSDKSLQWVTNNRELLRIWWYIVDFLPMTDDLVNAHMTMGTPNWELANAKLKELFL